VEGRRNWYDRLVIDHNKPVLWIHAASLGEFEQGRPVIEAFRAQYPDWAIVLTFFSPSGYEIRKNYPHADLVCYLPADTTRNARRFIELIQPQVAIFVKYEFWSNYLAELKNRDTPTLLISGIFRPSQPFFAWYGAFWRNMLRCFTHFFVQTTESAALLKSIGFENTTVAGDTRIDRVLTLAGTAPENALVARFANAPPLVVGSSWPADEAIYLPVLEDPALKHLKVVIAPHEPSAAYVNRLIDQLGAQAVRYSTANPETVGNARYLIIDNIGMLNTLYQYGFAAYIGGGFGKGIHNTLEPAAYGLPVLFGPRFEKFEEARQLVASGGAFAIQDAASLRQNLLQLQHPESVKAASWAVTRWLSENQGATNKILSWLGQNNIQRG
jgi:3-deoxy-D-manno-octulosonic-acid transferase